jgi:hypothetical protein
MKLLSGDFINFISENIDKKIILGSEQSCYPTCNLVFDGKYLKNIN